MCVRMYIRMYIHLCVYTCAVFHIAIVLHMRARTPVGRHLSLIHILIVFSCNTFWKFAVFRMGFLRVGERVGPFLLHQPANRLEVP